MSNECTINELDLHRFLSEQAAQAIIGQRWQERHNRMQRLIGRMQALSDAEFESTYHALESIVDNFQGRKERAGTPGNRAASTEKDLSLDDKNTTQIQKKSA